MLYKKEGIPDEDELVLCTKLLQSLIKGCATFIQFVHSVPLKIGGKFYVI